MSSVDHSLRTILRRIDDIDKRLQNVARRERGFSRRATTKTIASGSITADWHDFYLLLPESGVTDDLDTIAGAADGRRIVISTATVGHSITVKHNTGNIVTGDGTDILLSSPNFALYLIYNDEIEKWVAVGAAATGGGGGLDAETLDGLDSTAFVLVTDYEDLDVLNKVKNVDGVGSGLDADLLDGLSSAAFAAAVHVHSGADITSGIVDEAYIDADITRDSEVFGIVLANDGAGSGLDADLLDGLSSAAFAAAVHVHDGADITTGTVADARIASTITRDSEVFGIVLANDGSGSGLDADLLDGIDSTGFSLSGHTHSYQPLDSELTAIAGLVSAADTGIYFTGSGTASLFDLTSFARTLLDDANQGAMRTTLGLVPGTDVQAFDSTLLSIAALGTVADRIAYTTGIDTWAETPLTAFARTLLDDANQGAMQTTLGLVIGTNVQAFDAELAAIAGLTSAADKLAYFTGSGTAALTDFSSFARTLVDDANAGAMQSTLGLVIGTNVQAFDATLLSIAALGTAADKIAYTTGVDTWAETAITSFGRSLIDDAAASNARTTLELGTIATEAETNYFLLGGRATPQTAAFGTASGATAGYLTSTIHATKGKYSLNAAGTIVVDEANVRLGVGVATPSVRIEVETDGADTNVRLGAFGTGFKSQLLLFSANGTQASPTATQLGDELGRISFQGWDTARSTGAAIYALAAAEWGTAGDTTDDPTDIRFATVPDGSGTLADVMSITSGARVGILTTSPQATLHVGAGADAPTASNVVLYVTETGATAAAVRNSTDNVEVAVRVSTTAGSMGTVTNHALGILTNGSNRIFIEATGNIGILNTSPQAALHVGAGADTPVLASAVGYFTNTGSVAVEVRDNTNNVSSFLYADSSGGLTGTVTTHSFGIRTDNTTRLRILSTGEVGIGATAPTTPTGVLSLQAGTSTDHVNAGGILYVSTAQVGNVGSGEDVLASISVPANTLHVDNQSLWYEAWGTAANNANTKTLRVRFGTTGTNLVDSVAPTANNAWTWRVRGRIFRTGAATQKSLAESLLVRAGTTNGNVTITSTLDQTLSGAITLEVTGEATSNNDLVCEGFIVGWDDNNT